MILPVLKNKVTYIKIENYKQHKTIKQQAMTSNAGNTINDK